MDEGVTGAEEARAKVFSLEEENASLKRRAELELPSEIDGLRHQVGSDVARGAMVLSLRDPRSVFLKPSGWVLGVEVVRLDDGSLGASVHHARRQPRDASYGGVDSHARLE